MEPLKCSLLHDLLNSLTVVLGECELLQDTNCAEANSRLTVIREQANHMTDIIRHHRCPTERYTAPRESVFRSLLRVVTSR